MHHTPEGRIKYPRKQIFYSYNKALRSYIFICLCVYVWIIFRTPVGLYKKFPIVDDIHDDIHEGANITLTFKNYYI